MLSTPIPNSTGAAQETPEITKIMSAASKSATPTALEGGNCNLNLTLPTCLEVQELPANTVSDVKTTGRFGTNENGSTFRKSNKNLPVVENNTLDSLVIIEETGNIHTVFR